MGCSSSTSGRVPYGNPIVDIGQCADESNANTEHDGNDVLVTLDEAVRFTMAELSLTYERAKELVLTVDQNSDGLLSSAELVQLNEKIREAKQRLLPRFRHHDPDETGFVEPMDAVSILTKEFQGLPYRCIIAMVNRFDKDMNDKVDFGEFVEFYSYVKAKKHLMEKKFAELDADGSGDLDTDELIHTLMKECALKEVQARTLVDDFDLNKDGRIGLEEFNHMWTTLFG